MLFGRKGLKPWQPGIGLHVLQPWELTILFAYLMGGLRLSKKWCLGILRLYLPSRDHKHSMSCGYTVFASFCFRKQITRIYRATLDWRVMNSTVNKWQVLRFLLLSIMYTSLYVWSFQQVWNANGLRNAFTNLLPPIRKTSLSLEHQPLLGSSQFYSSLTWAGSERACSSTWFTGKPPYLSVVCFGTVRSTPVADWALPHWETTAVCETRAIEIEPEQYEARCSPSLSLLQQEDGLGPPLTQSMPYASHQVLLSFSSVSLFVKGEWKDIVE